MIEAASVGAALRQLRSGCGVSQVDAAKAAGLALTVLNRAETGKSLLSLKSLVAVLDGIGADLHDFARALDAVTGRGPGEVRGRPNARWVAMMAGRPLDEDWLYGFAAAVLDPEDAQAREDFVASVVSVAETRARSALAELDAHAAAVAEKPALPEQPVSQTVQPKKKGKT